MAAPQKKHWLNKGGNYRRSGGQVVKPGEVFQAYESEIPNAFRDTIVETEPPKRQRRRRSSGQSQEGSDDEGESGEEAGEFALEGAEPE